jgi:hypothetical protein
MRKTAIFLTFLFSCSSFAQSSLLEVHFEKQKKEHHYSIKRDQKKKNSYIFSFVNEKRKVKNKYLTSKQFEQIKNEANRLLWANQFRKPASFENCKEYMTLVIENEKTKVCQQNNKLTGKSFGFLNSLNNLAR